jgi:amino acid transporter
MRKGILDLLIGEPLPNERRSHERYNVPLGLAVMASDAISSVAYASEEILYVLIGVLGLASYTWLGWVALMIIGLLFILTISYIQIIDAYPGGGGAYIVAKENMGTRYGLVAGAALLIDYILTVAVSASSGVAAIISAYPSLAPDRVILVIGLIAILTILNLRGISESSRIFSLPTYLFIVSILFMIIYGFIKYFLYGPSAPMVGSPPDITGEVSLFLILRAFSSGCSALTGLEAVSNSVPNFREPGQKNAKIVMFLLSGLILFIFGGTSVLTRFYHAIPAGNPTVIAQIAHGVFGNTFMFYVIQITTAIILIMACNTAFTGFPMLMYVIAKDGFMPRQFSIRGKRLSFSTGIVALSLVACILVIIFGATTHRLIPLYSVGVFLSFTLAQLGMVIHWKKNGEESSRRRSIINGFGAVITAITTVVIAFEKFTGGAWIVAILIPLIVLIMISIKRHYTRVADNLRASIDDLRNAKLDKHTRHLMIVPIASINKAALGALRYARSITPEVTALNISTDREAMQKLEDRWKELNTDIVLETKYSPFRTVVTPLIQYIDDTAKAAGDSEIITVLLPQFVIHKWWGRILHNQTSFFLRENLLMHENVIVSTYPYHIKD